MLKDLCLETEKRRILRAKKDLKNFDFLYRKYFPKINNFVFYRVENEAIRNDIVSNVFFKAMKKLTFFRFINSRKCSFSSWLFRIAVNEINQYYRNLKRENKIMEMSLANPQTNSELDYDLVKEKMKNLSEKYRKKIGLEDQYGVLIEKVVKDGPVQKAGMQDDDVILKIGEDKVYTSDQVSQMLNYLKPEQQVKITIFRDKEYKTFDVILGEKKIPPFEFDTSGIEFLHDIPENVFVYKYDEKNGKWIGIQPKELNEQLLKTYNLENGVLIEKVFENTPAEDAGLLAGDVITHINDQIMENTKGIIKLIQSKEIDDEIDIAIKRGTELKIIKTKIGKRHDLHSDQKVEVSFDEGDVRIMIDGDEELLLDLGDLKELDKLKELQYLKGEKMEHFNEQMEKLGEKLKDIKIDIKKTSESKDI